ncbi:MAG: DUF853 family protein [Elusimicrobia bacterium]|nr:DUF853 family protein [Elusimicrobiota bacterium]
MTKSLRLAEDLALPLDAVTQTFGILAVRGAGKSNLAAVMAEEMFDAGLPFVVVDPVGSWWGLRSELAIPIFGGRHADVPLEKTGGALVADLVVGQRLTCVLDVSELSEGDKTRFLIDFAERLYRQNTEPLHLFLEEADDFCPQRPFHEQARLVRSWENVVRRGRARGLGITMITQRSAALNKNVLTQIETLFVLRTTSPQDRKAIEGWVEYHGQAREVLESLSSLAAGEAWVWSPSYLKTMKRVQVRRRRTFDSGATPKSGSSRKPATLADVDLGAVTKAMAATIERAKTEDPRELRRRIAELERELKAKPQQRVEVPVLKAKDRATIEWAASRLEQGVEKALLIAKVAADLRAALQGTNASGVASAHTARSDAQRVGRDSGAPREVLGSRPSRGPLHTGVPTVPKGGRPSPSTLGNSGKRRILVALAQSPDGLTKTKLSLLTGISQRGGTWRTYLGELRSSGAVADIPGGLAITDAGMKLLGNGWAPLPTGEALIDFWRARLGESGKRRLFDVLVSVYPRALSPAEAAERSGMETEGGTWRTYLGELRGLELVTGRGELRASEDLFS